MVSVAWLRVSWGLGVLHGQSVIQAVLQRFVLRVVGRRRLALLPVSCDEARPYPGTKSKSSIDLRLRLNLVAGTHLRVRVHLVVLGFGRVFSTTAAKEQEQGGEQQEHGTAHHQSDQSWRGECACLGDIRRADWRENSNFKNQLGPILALRDSLVEGRGKRKEKEGNATHS